MDRALPKCLPAMNSQLPAANEDDARAAITCTLLSKVEACQPIDEMREKVNAAWAVNPAMSNQSFRRRPGNDLTG
jgi:hypothetical protein